MTPLQLALILKTFNSKDVISPHLVHIIVTCVFGVSLCVSYLVVAVSQNLTDSVRSTAGNPLEDQHDRLSASRVEPLRRIFRGHRASHEKCILLSFVKLVEGKS